MQTIKALIINVLNDMKAESIVNLDVRKLSSFTDDMLIATANSKRHTRAIANKVIDEIFLQTTMYPMGIEGLDVDEWILLDYNDCMVHIMTEETRDYYALEKLWTDTTLYSQQAIA